MRSITVIVSLVFLLLLPFIAHGSERVHWAYDGAFGPDRWSDLSLDFGACNEGTQQSPVNLTGALETYLEPVDLHWASSDWETRNTGHTITAAPVEGGYAMIEDTRYDLIQIKLHNPSEHQINGRSYPMEAHFVHRAESGEMAVIGVMIKGGGMNPLFESLMAKAPVRENGRDQLRGFDPTGLATDLSDVLRYRGSLTAPPCTENVLWTVLTDPLVVSDATLLAFNSLFPHNARPVQPLNRRYVLSD